jgi:hypothetical protein
MLLISARDTQDESYKMDISGKVFKEVKTENQLKLSS